MTTCLHPRRLLTILSVAVLTIAASCNTNGPSRPLVDSSADRPTAAPARSQAIVDAPANIRTFAPKETAIASPVAAEDIDLRKIFEDLGPDATMWYQHVQTLADPFLGGREPDTRGDDLAAEYIEFYFKECGLEPAFSIATAQLSGDDHTARSNYMQPFDFRSPSPEVKVIATRLSFNGMDLTDQTDFTVLGISGNGEITAPITFVGYGIEQGRDGYTSFDDNTDLTGRIAMVMRYEPLNEQGKSRWSESRFSRHAGIAPKMANLIKRGAAGIILVNPPRAIDGKKTLESVKESGRFGNRLDIPVFQVTADVADQIVKQADPEHRDLLTLRRLADDSKVKSVGLDDTVKVSLASNLDVKDRLYTQNVGALLRGKGNLSDQWIVIGAHFDHVGFGYTGAQPNNIGKLHPGADDNASGTAAMLIAARRLADHYQKAGDDSSLRSVCFVAFSAEEAGLHGSKHFVENSPVGNSATTLMINMDMVGRLRSNNLLVQGTRTAHGLSELLQPHFERSGMTISAMPGGRGPSDHANFFSERIPVLFLFTGEHADYHKPTDHAYTVNPAGAMKVTDLLVAITKEIAARPEKLEFINDSDGGAISSRETGAKVSLGTMPDYTAELETGMRVEGVRKGSSADEGGIQAGDILLTWNSQEISGPRSLGEFLIKHEPGDVVKIALLRGETELTVDVKLQSRAAQ